MNKSFLFQSINFQRVLVILEGQKGTAFQNAVKIQSKFSQNLIKMQLKFRQFLKCQWTEKFSVLLTIYLCFVVCFCNFCCLQFFTVELTHTATFVQEKVIINKPQNFMLFVFFIIIFLSEKNSALFHNRPAFSAFAHCVFQAYFSSRKNTKSRQNVEFYKKELILP